jgi:hypothetical protein
MAVDDRIIWRHDVSPADWIGSRLRPFGADTGSVVPEGFEAYCRIFHPVEPQWPDTAARTWAQVAAENGRTAHGQMQFHMINRPARTPPPPTYLKDAGPSWGSLPHRERAVLVDLLRPRTATPTQCWFCVWEGFADVEYGHVSARVRHPGRDYLLYGGPIELALASLDTPWEGRSPNLWWPEDRAWIVATEIDYCWTYVGGTAATVETVLASDGIEALPVELSDSPFYDGDEVNAALDGL